MQDLYLEEFLTDTSMSPYNPFEERFKQIDEKHRDIVKSVGYLRRKLAEQKPRISWWEKLEKLWKKHNLLGTLILIALVPVLGGIWHATRIVIDDHIVSLIKPVSDGLQTNNREIARVGGMVAVLQGQIAAQKYSSYQPAELKEHSEELKQIKSNLSQTKTVPPNFWPVSFQIINLLAKSGFDPDKVNPEEESSFGDISSNPPSAFGPLVNQRVHLSGGISGIIFRNCIVRFEPNVRLTNDLFINCLFIFPEAENPSPTFQQIGHELLASDVSRVTLNSL